MKDMLEISCVNIIQGAASWEEAVYKAVEPLKDQGYVEARYADEIIKNAKELGPYFIIAPKVALLHARPDQGAIKIQLGVTVMREAINFADDDRDIYLLITLSATDDETHINVMRDLANILIIPGRIEKIIESKTPQEVLLNFTSDS